MPATSHQPGRRVAVAARDVDPALEGAGHSPLVRRLAAALAMEGISYCQWKGHWDPERTLRAEGDIDLLVARDGASGLAALVARLGFKQVVPPYSRQTPGILSYFGFDPGLQRVVHLHVHYQLRLGHGGTLDDHVPIENAMLSSTVPGPVFRVPAPELEFILFVVRMVFAQTLVGVLRRQALPLSERRTAEFHYLAARVDEHNVRALLKQHLPAIEWSLFDQCVKSLSPDVPILTRIRLKRALRWVCAAECRRPPAGRGVRRVLRAGAARLRRAFVGARRNQLQTGGALVAILGGDGAGKSTAVRELNAWLSPSFETVQLHLGKPPRSIATLLVAILRRVFALLVLTPEADRQGPHLLLMIRSVSIARDRYRLYKRARRAAMNGRLVICDRYPTPFIKSMDGASIRLQPRTAGRAALMRALQRWERAYYDRILPPDLLIVLRVHPDVAAARKTDEESGYVRARSREVWELDLRATPAIVIDANRPQPEVLADLRTLVWSRL